MEELKVLIVDDESMAIDYLRELIPWQKHGYKIVAAATEAKQALKCFQEYHPQIVISDICMPGIDGLEFCKSILEIDSSAKIILLTAYKEFEYAKRAIELGVSNYLLKHEISEDTLLKVLSKVREEFKKEQKTNQIIKKHIIMNIMEGTGNIKNNPSFQWELIENKGGAFILLLLTADTPYPILNTMKEEIDKRFEGIKSEQVRKGLEDGLKCICENIEDGFTFIDSFNLRSRKWVVLFSCDNYLGEGVLWNRFYPIAVKVQMFFSKTLEYPFSGVLEMERQKIENISKMYKMSLKALDYLPFIGKSKIICEYDFSYRGKLEDVEGKAGRIIYNISRALDEQNLQNVEEDLEKLFTEIIIPGFDPKLLRQCCDELMDIANKWQEKNFLMSLENETGELRTQMENCYTVIDVKQTFKEIFKRGIKSVLDSRYGSYSKNVQEAIKYLHKHFSKDISVIDVANAVQISDSNLSRMFKSETGQSPLEYLTAIRIEKAKKLLKESNMMIYEISETVGYKTSQYFSQVFKKVTGMNPLEFREDKKNIDQE